MKKVNSIIKPLFILLLCPGILFAAAFGPAKSLINIPVAEYFIPGDIQFSANGGFGSMQNIEFDFKINYSLTKKFNFGATIINYHQIVFNAQGTFVTLEEPFPIKISAGLINLSSKLDISDWDNDTAQRIHNLGHFIVASMPKSNYTLHVGIGKKKYRSLANQNIEADTGPFIGTLFFGYEKEMKNGKFMAEFDGSFLNFGFQQYFGKKVQGKAALTELGNSGADAPVRFLSFGLSTERNIFDVYKDEVIEVQNKLDTLEGLSQSLKSTEDQLRNELVNVQKTKEELIFKVKNINNPSNQKLYNHNDNDALKVYSKDYILAYSHYEEAFERYKKRDVIGMLTLLTKAINLAPNVSIFYRQRGSGYYSINQKENALDDWAKAYKLNRFDNEILKLPKSILDEVKRRASL